MIDKDIVPTVGDSHSDILWQNTSGQAAIWDMNGTNVVGGGTCSPNPGPSWNAIGTGDFNDDGHSDILWQNANGQAAIWEMNGTNIDRRRGTSAPIPGRAGKRSERATSMTTAIPTSCGRTRTARPRSGK